MDLMNGRRYVQPKHSGSKIDSSHFRIGRAGSAFLLNRPMKIDPFQIRRAVLVLALSLSSCALVGGGRVRSEERRVGKECVP